MNESETPRTTKLIGIAFGADGHGADYDAYVIMMAHAKKLEQESNMLLEALRQMRDSAVACGWEDADIENAREAIAAAEKAREQS